MSTDFKISGAINSIEILLANHYDPNSLKEKKKPCLLKGTKSPNILHKTQVFTNFEVKLT